MIFADKQVKAMRKLGVMPEIFVLESRTNPALLRRESGRFQQCIASPPAGPDPCAIWDGDGLSRRSDDDDSAGHYLSRQ